MPFYVRAPRQRRWIRQGEESKASKRKRIKIYKSYAMHSDANKAQWLQSPKVNIQTQTHTHWNISQMIGHGMCYCYCHWMCWIRLMWVMCMCARRIFFFFSHLQLFAIKRKKIIKNKPTDWEKYLLENDWATICSKHSR